MKFVSAAAEKNYLEFLAPQRVTLRENYHSYTAVRMAEVAVPERDRGDIMLYKTISVPGVSTESDPYAPYVTIVYMRDRGQEVPDAQHWIILP